MKVPYGEGVASHTGPESCAGGGNRVREALTGERAGRPLSRENEAPRKREVRGADAVEVSGRPRWASREREACLVPARSETPRMHGSISYGNREIPRSPGAQVPGRTGNPEGKSR